MITEAETKLLRKMIDLGAEEELIHCVCSALTTEQQEQAVQMLENHQKKHGTVSEEEMMKMVIMLTGKRKVGCRLADRPQGFPRC